MEITTELVEHLADLSRLEFSNEEAENFKQEFSKVLEQVDKLSKANVDNVGIKEETLNAKSELRPDEIKQGLTNKEAIKNAPETLGNSVLVPVEII